MCWTLGIDTSSTELGLALVHDTAPAAVYSRYGRNSHAEQIAKALDFLCAQCGIRPDSIAKIGVAVGPGSFTGLRIGIAFVKGLCCGRALPVLPVSSLLCAAAALTGHNGPVVVAYEARREEIFWARFFVQGATVTRLTEDRRDELKTVAALLTAEDYCVTDSLGFSGSALASLGQGALRHAVESAPLNRGYACARLAAAEPQNSTLWTRAGMVTPAYAQDFPAPAHP